MDKHSASAGEARRLDDALFAAAWEEVGAQDRALMKTAIAWHFHRLGRCGGSGSGERISRGAGFGMRWQDRPAPWVLAALEEGFASPARLLAWLVPALLAGVAQVAVASPCPPPPAILAALELAGIEDVFLASPDGMRRMLEDFAQDAGRGRLVRFCGAGGAMDGLEARARQLGVPCQSVPAAPRIAILDQESAEGMRELRRRIALFHPDAQIPGGDEKAAFADAAYGAPEGMPPREAWPALYGEGMEACWTGAGTDFYRNFCSNAFPAPEEDA